MATRYEFSDEDRTVVPNLFSETNGRGGGRSPKDRLMLDGVLRVLCTLLSCRVARYARTLWPVVNGLSPVPRQAKNTGYSIRYLDACTSDGMSKA